MSLSYTAYPQWQETADTLSALFQLIGSLKGERTRTPFHTRLGLYPTLNGLTTGILPCDTSPFVISLNLNEHYILMRNAQGKKIRIRMQDGISVAHYCKQINHALDYIGSPTQLPETYADDEQPRSYNAEAVARFHAHLLEEFIALKPTLSAKELEDQLMALLLPAR